MPKATKHPDAVDKVYQLAGELVQALWIASPKAPALCQELHDALQVPRETVTEITCYRRDKEWRVPSPDGREEGAYYTDDKLDAEGTARHMYGNPDLIVNFRSK